MKTINACVVHCIDHRIQKTVDELLRSLGLLNKAFDRISIPGGAGDFEQVHTYLAFSMRVHKPDVIILITHDDCRAEVTEDDLNKVLDGVKKRYPSYKTVAYVIALNGEWRQV